MKNESGMRIKRGLIILVTILLLALGFSMATAWNYGRLTALDASVFMKDDRSNSSNYNVELHLLEDEVMIKGWFLSADMLAKKGKFDATNYNILLLTEGGKFCRMETIMSDEFSLEETFGKDKNYFKGGFYASSYRKNLDPEETYRIYLTYERKEKTYIVDLHQEVIL